jgi:hypothetical protein
VKQKDRTGALRTLGALLIALGLIAPLPHRAVAYSESQVETRTRFLEYDQATGMLAYMISLRNLGNLTVSFVEVSADPPGSEGPFEISDLSKGQMVSRRFSFHLPPGQMLFQPRFNLAYTNFEGQRILIESQERLISTTVDFAECDVETGRVVLDLSIVNIGSGPLIFMELKTDNPHLEGGTLGLEDLKVGKQLKQSIEFQLDPNEIFFNPTLYLTYHAFQTESTQRHRNFITILQPDLRRIESALAERRREP